MFENFANVWTIVGLADDVIAVKPLAMKVAGERVVFFRDANGKAAAILISTPAGGCVILNDSQGQLIDSLPGVPPDEDDEE